MKAMEAAGFSIVEDHNRPGTVGAGRMPMSSGITTATQVAAGNSHSLALLANGTVDAWGANGNGQLGDGSTTASSTPVPVSGITTATQVAAGGFHGLALLVNGTVDAWRWNRNGQLGNGSTTDTLTPVQVSGLSQVVAIAASNTTSYALESDGTLWAWGYNGVGQLGNGSATDSSTPVQVANLGGETLSISSGIGASHALAIVGPRASVSPASLAFGHQTVGSNTAVQAVTLNAAPGPTVGSGLRRRFRWSGCRLVHDQLRRL